MLGDTDKGARDAEAYRKEPRTSAAAKSHQLGAIDETGRYAEAAESTNAPASKPTPRWRWN
jgi:hypothetical protein